LRIKFCNSALCLFAAFFSLPLIFLFSAFWELSCYLTSCFRHTIATLFVLKSSLQQGSVGIALSEAIYFFQSLQVLNDRTTRSLTTYTNTPAINALEKSFLWGFSSYLKSEGSSIAHILTII
jgi:hypothetical protein